MRFAIIALAILTGCTGAPFDVARNVDAPPPTSSRVPVPATKPTIEHVTPIQPEQTQRIVIKGTGFGTKQPYNGDSCCIQFTMTNELPPCRNTWQAGKTGELVTLHVKQWTDKRILVAGFTGEYGQNCWEIHQGDPIEIQVWNPQNRGRPAHWKGRVQ